MKGQLDDLRGVTRDELVACQRGERPPARSLDDRRHSASRRLLPLQGPLWAAFGRARNSKRLLQGLPAAPSCGCCCALRGVSLCAPVKLLELLPRRLDSAGLPTREVAQVLTRQENAPVGFEQPRVGARQALVFPVGPTALALGNQVPGYREGRLKRLRVLRVNLAALLDSIGGAAFGCAAAHCDSVAPEIVVAEQDAFLLTEAVRRVGDLSHEVGGGVSTVDVVVLPEAAVKLQADLAGRLVRNSGDGGLEFGREVRVNAV